MVLSLSLSDGAAQHHDSLNSQRDGATWHVAPSARVTISASLRVPVAAPRLMIALSYVILALLRHGHIQGAKGEAEHCSRPWTAVLHRARPDCRSAQDQEMCAVIKMSFPLHSRAIPF
jgi:hypothetical protein